MDVDDCAALCAYTVHGFADNGRPFFDCENCTHDEKVKNGCGKEHLYRGKSHLPWPPDMVDINSIYNNTCPGYYQNSIFLSSFLKWYNWKSNYPDPYNLDARFLDCVERYEYYKNFVEQRNRKLKENVS